MSCRHILRIVVIACCLASNAQSSTTTSQEGGYEVTRSQTVVPFPHGKRGRKTIDRETRVGITEVTDGNSSSFSMTFGGFMNGCPVPEGPAPVKFVVPGDFEYSLVADTVDTNVVPTARLRFVKRVTARVKVFVNDDLSVTEGEFNGEYMSEMAGVRSAPVPIRRRFRIEEGGMPDFEALKDVATVTGDLAAAALMWNVGMIAYGAQSDWVKPNACAELQFEPLSESRSLGPNETVEIRAKYQTREDRKLIPRGTWNATPYGSGSRVTETTGRVREDGSFAVKYTAGSNPKEGDGVKIDAGSAGGYALEMWKILAGGDYELHFESSVVSRELVQSVRSTAQGNVRLTSSTKPWRRKPDGKQYLLYDGNGTVQFNSAPGPERDACAPLISGAGTSDFKVLETFIQITPPSEQNGARVAGKADVQMTYWIAMGAGETEMTPTNVNYQCVPGHVDALAYWWMAYISGREPDGDVNFLTQWEYVGQDGVVARKVLTGNCKGMCSEERSVFTLRKVASQ